MTVLHRPQLRRWGVFNLVGVAGFTVQLAVLAILKHVFYFNYLAATGLAVEIAVLHNFVWHQRVTWADVVAPLRQGVLRRLLRFHLANGLISLAGNIAFTWTFVALLQWPYLTANIASVAICSLLNFFASDRFVFRENQYQGCRQGPVLD